MELGLETISTKGRAAKAAPPVSSRVVPAEEVASSLTRERGIEAAPLKRLSARHRRLAELLAMGQTPGQAAVLVGYSPSRVSILLADETFKDLVERFRIDLEEGVLTEAKNLASKLSDISLEAADEILERLENDPDSFDHKDLKALLELSADRTGHGPKRTEEKNVNVNFGARLEEARKRALAAQNANTIEGELVEAAE